uniref:Uncharacterized protein n=1 Tax=Heliothis virescens TaxID=7102 RepID=A0A2A4K123_HELVI
MRGSCKRFGPEMCDFSTLSTEKQELVKMFVDYLQSDKRKSHGHGHHGHHGKFGKHGHGKFGHFGKHGHGRHGMHVGRHGPHGHCGPHGRRGPHGHGGHGRPHGHCHRGRHGLHGKHGKFWAQWSIDLTEESDDSQAMESAVETGRNPSPPPAETTNQEDEGNNTDKCKCSCFGRKHGGRFGRRKLHKRNQAPMAENSSQTEDNTQENLTEMVENINIDTTE